MAGSVEVEPFARTTYPEAAVIVGTVLISTGEGIANLTDVALKANPKPMGYCDAPSGSIAK